MFTGREWDKETGLYYYNARYYDPMEGRFVSKDPIGFDGGDVNLYAYVRNNPVNLKDPSGLSPAVDPNNPGQQPYEPLNESVKRLKDYYKKKAKSGGVGTFLKT